MLSCIRLPLRSTPRRCRPTCTRCPDDGLGAALQHELLHGRLERRRAALGGRRRPRDLPRPEPDGVWEDTEILGYCPALAAAVAAFECEKTAVRLLRLGPGASVREHTDYNLGYDDGEVRFHVPVLTNPDAVFELEGRALDMQPGESWYLDFNLKHRVANGGADAARPPRDRLRRERLGQPDARGGRAGLTGRSSTT